MSHLKLSFFFQAEDGIRDIGVTGVQTCALPIFRQHVGGASSIAGGGMTMARPAETITAHVTGTAAACSSSPHAGPGACGAPRSEERRVGKECRSRWSPYH